MITKNTSPKIAFLKQFLVIIVLITAVFAFSSKSILAQEIKEIVQPVIKSSTEPKDSTLSSWAGMFAGGTKEGVSQELLDEYQSIIKRAQTEDMSGPDSRKKIPQIDKEKLKAIFKKMSRAQQEQQAIIFLKPSPPLPRVVPTEKQFEKFKNEKVYGVWIDEKKVANSILNNYTTKDFAQFFISKLYGAAKKNKIYSYQVNLMTNDYYQAYYDRTIADTTYTMIFQSRKLAKE